MRIAFLSDAVYPWNIGGLESLESTEAIELAKNHEVHFFSLRWPGMKKDFTQNNISYHTLHDITVDEFYRHGRRSIREAIAYTIGLGRLLFYRFDYIQSNEFPIIHIPLLKIYCKLTGCKLILDMHEVWDREYWISYIGNIWGVLANSFASWAINNADAYISNSSVTAEKLANLGVPEERIYVFSPVINDEKLNSIEVKKETKTVILPTRLIKEKRIDKWLIAVKNASRKINQIKGIIIGKGPEKSSISKMIEKLHLSKTVELREFYATEDKIDLYKKIKESKLLLQMSEREGLSIIVLESLALGTPVLLPDYSPIPKEVKEMCIVKDEISISDAIVEILNSKDKSKYIKNKEKLKTFSISNVNAFYSNLFRKISDKQ
ncbi:MAG: glycosyltransferase family 4 protein [Candidatus Micrarchaeaceae archaeon]|jgi:L-malate glycosyltransferase